MPGVRDYLRRTMTPQREARHRRAFDGILAVVTECTREAASGWVTVTCSRLLGTDYEYNTVANAGDEFTAHAGVDPGVVLDSLVCLQHIEPLPNDPEIEWLAIPVFAFPPETFDIPEWNCLTAATEPCAENTPSSLCVG